MGDDIVYFDECYHVPPGYYFKITDLEAYIAEKRMQWPNYPYMSTNELVIFLNQHLEEGD